MATTVIVEPYNPEWPNQFLRIKKELEILLRDVDFISIEHVGSTSVPQLAAKPIIDVDIIVTRENVESTIDAMKGARFIHLGELGIVDRHCLRSPNQNPPRNIYVCVSGCFQLRNHQSVRNVLLSDSNLREEYGNVKLQLASKGIDVNSYTEAKSEILQKILRKAGIHSEEELGEIQSANVAKRYSLIKTERLILREYVMSDSVPFFRLESDERVYRYQLQYPSDLYEAEQMVANVIRSSYETPRSVIELAVIRDGKFIGRVGAAITPKEFTNNAEKPHVLLWYSFLPESQGQGYATESMNAFLPLLGNGITLEIECDPRNLNSRKMAQRLGFQAFNFTKKVFECRGEWVDSLVYRKEI